MKCSVSRTEISFAFETFKIIFFLLQNAILKYNASTAKKWDFTALQLYCTKVIDPNWILIEITCLVID